MDYYLKVLVVLSCFVVVLFFALFMTKRFAKHKFNGEIKVLDRLSVNQHVSLLLVSVRDSVFFISVGSRNATFLDKVS